MKCIHEKPQIWPDIYIGPGCDCDKTNDTEEPETAK